MKEIIKSNREIDTIKCRTKYIQDDLCFTLLDNYLRDITDNEVIFQKRFPKFQDELVGIRRGYQFPDINTEHYFIQTFVEYDCTMEAMYLEITVYGKVYTIVEL